MEATLPSTAWLERANRHVLTARLLASTVHDVNNALQVISGNSELLQSASADPAVLKRGQTIHSHAHRASGLLTELMAFVKDADDRRRSLRMNAIATRAVSMRQYALTKLRITTSVAGDEGPVVGNQRQLVQIALNLITNAEQALSGRPEAALRLVVERNADVTRLSVTDNGPGLDPGVERLLFATMPDVSQSTDGLGIGLAVSKWLAGEQGGSLTFTRPAGGGSTFVLSLPSA